MRARAQELDAALAAAGLAAPGARAPGARALAPLWRAVCAVWASKWGDRAWLSRRARGVPEGDLAMSVLLQQVRALLLLLWQLCVCVCVWLGVC